MSTFSLGVAVGWYEMFPFKLLRSGCNYFRQAPPKNGLAQSEQRNTSLIYRLQAPMFEAFPGRADIVMLGDSITALAQWDDIFPGKAIANRGIQGDTIQGIRDRLGAVIQLNPHKVFIMGGINNLLGGSDAEQVLPLYEDVVRKLQSAGVQVFVQSTLLTGESDTPVNGEVRKLNGALRHFCFVDQVCSFIDLNARLAPDGYLVQTLDGVHLTPAGYAIWRDEIAPNLREK